MFTLNNFFNFYNFLNKDTTKNLILEPYSCIFKLILLQYKNKGTKISILNNSLTYYEPSIAQGILRNINGDSRSDLHNLYNPIIKCMEWCIKDNDINNYFFINCIKGLELLKENYDNNTIINYTLTHYIKIINNFLNNNEIDKINDIKESPIINGLKDIWEVSEIKLVYDLFNYIEKINDNDQRDIYIKNIYDLISFKEKIVKEYIDKNSTTYN